MFRTVPGTDPLKSLEEQPCRSEDGLYWCDNACALKADWFLGIICQKKPVFSCDDDEIEFSAAIGTGLTMLVSCFCFPVPMRDL